jgi:type IV secretory pathway VirD2 relaxase
LALPVLVQLCRNLAGIKQLDDEFEPRLGRLHSSGKSSGRSRKYLHAVLAATARAGGPKQAARRRFHGGRIGRGGVAARALAAGERYPGIRARRAIVKARLVRLAGKGLAAARAHLRYLQRDGVTRDGEPAGLYSASGDAADGKTFLERCAGDRHQFRLIVSAEDGCEYEDLRPLVRRFMAAMEEDLGTRLEWVAADHLDTLHPHTHIILRGKDERGSNLVIAPDYIKRGMRERLASLVSVDLGPRTDAEIERGLRLEVDAERLTSIDRRLLRDLDLDRTVGAAGRDMADHALRTGRLRKLHALGLAEPLGDGRWRLARELEPTLRALGERGDIIRLLQRELKAAGLERGAPDRLIYAPKAGMSLTGRLVARGLADELRDDHYLVIDGVDGRSHYVAIGSGKATGPLPDHAIVRVSPRMARGRETDERIATIAVAHGGRYSAELHLVAEPGASKRFAEAHVRRLEAIRRTVGGVVRADDGSWTIPANFGELARRHEQLQEQRTPVDVTVLSALPLERLVDHDGATWLDRELVAPRENPRDSGFGREVRSALSARRSWLVGQGLASEDSDQLRFQPDMLTLLEERELLRAAARISGDTGLEFVGAIEGSQIEGIVRRRLELASGRFAMIDNGRQFSLVPWRPVLERALGRYVKGSVRGAGAISWSIGRERGIGR